ncbi:MAG: putative DNA-binding domain-containing protein [Fibrobacteres bacterium]|nr:putative DNA-binding domain-containing protein [Fibrobacterota bacterium]
MPDALLEFQERWMRSASAPLRFLAPGVADAPSSDYDPLLVQDIVPAQSVSAIDRLGAYRRQYWYRLFTLMQEEHPIAGLLEGWEAFNPLADRFLRTRLPGRNLTDLASGFPSWLRSVGATDQLVEACRVDAALSRCFRAGTLALPGEDDLAALGDGTLDLVLQPAVQILRTERDWLALRARPTDSVASMGIPPLAPAVWVLSRQGTTIAWDSVDPRLGKLLDAMRRGSGWRETLERAATRSPAIVDRIAEWFALGASRQWWGVRG